MTMTKEAIVNQIVDVLRRARLDLENQDALGAFEALEEIEAIVKKGGD